MTENTVCSACGAENGPEQRFCGSCGASLGVACPACGASNPPGFRFCGSCGAAITVPAEEQEPVERRWATVLFADLSGFTTMSETMDPEDVRAMIDDCQRKMGAIIAQFGGVVNSVMGDGLMAMFGAPVAHEDDSERAVRAGLDLQRSVRENTEQFGGLPLRVGINSGDVMFGMVGSVGADARRDPTLIGDTTNTAARLQSAAPRGGILVGEETYRATRNAIRYEEVEPVSVKGKALPVPAWLAIEALLAPAERPVSAAPMVGRDREIALMTDLWGRVVVERRPHLVTLVAPPGTGKTRLATEFLQSIEGAGGRSYRGRSLPYGETTGYGALGRLIRSIFGIFVTDPPALAHSKLRRGIGDLVPSADAEALEEHIGVLAGLTDATVADRSILFAAARRLVEALARREPTVFMFEDIQWAEPSLLDLIEYLAGRVRDASAFFLTLTRPTLFDARPSWGGGLTAYNAIPLDTLHNADARALAVALLASREDANDVAERLLVAAGGNPLFIEELAASLLEDGSDAKSTLPSTIKGIIHARIDALSAQARKTILLASVMGEVFFRGALKQLSTEPSSVDDAIDELEIRDMIRREPSSRIQGEEEFAFKHGLLREAAYGTIPKTARRQMHGGVARFLEHTSEGGAVSPAAWLAYHWREAGDSDRAVDWLLKAAEQAARGWAAREGISLCDEALEILSPDDPRIRRARLSRAVALQSMKHQEWGDVSPTASGNGEA